MSAPTAAAESSTPPPPPARQEQADAVHQAASGDKAGADSSSVGTILAQLNQEQLESIVAAARASEANQHAGDDAEGAEEGGAAAAAAAAPRDEASIANLPPSLGQAASALTSFASSFKRSVHPVDGQDGEGADRADDAPPPPGAEYAPGQAVSSQDARKEQHNKAAHDTATAAAIASLGSLAAQQSQANAQSQHGSPSSNAGGGGGGGGSPEGTPGSSGAGKRSRAPEMDRARKDNHKEVERRRRSAIADGINQLAAIVPGCDARSTNKSSIIVSAVKYIQDLKHNEASNIEKWTLEKLLMDQAMGDLGAQLEETRRENERLRHLLAERGWTEEEALEGEGHEEPYDEEHHHHHHHQHHHHEEHQQHGHHDDHVDGHEVQEHEYRHTHHHDVEDIEPKQEEDQEDDAGAPTGTVGEKRTLDEMHQSGQDDGAPPPLTDEERAKRARVAA